MYDQTTYEETLGQRTERPAGPQKLESGLNVQRSTFVLAGLMLAALVIRLWGLNSVLWYDEAFSAWLAALPLNQLLQAAAGDVHPPGYYLVLWAVTKLGHSEAVLRLPSVLAGVGLVWVVNRFSITLQQGEKAVWLATIITAFSPFQVYYSQEARAYSLLMLAIGVCALGLIQRRWPLAVAGSLAALYLNNLALIFLASVWYAGFTYHVSRFTLEPKRFFGAGAVVGLGYLPGLALAVYQAGQVGTGYWIPPVTNPGRLLATLDDLLWFSPNNPFVLATGLITALGLVLLVRDWGSGVRDQGSGAFLFTSSFVPLSVVTLASLLWQPVLISRAVAACAPFYYLLLASAWSRVTRRLVTFAALAGPTVVLILAGPLLGSMGRVPGDEKLLGLYGEYQPGDGLYHANVGSYVVWHYYRPEMPQYVWPQETSIKQTLSAQTRAAMGMDEADFEAIKCSGPTRWWLIQFNNPVTTQAEIEYVNHLVSHNPSKKIALLRSDTTVEAWLYRIEPVCVNP